MIIGFLWIGTRMKIETVFRHHSVGFGILSLDSNLVFRTSFNYFPIFGNSNVRAAELSRAARWLGRLNYFLLAAHRTLSFSLRTSQDVCCLEVHRRSSSKVEEHSVQSILRPEMVTLHVGTNFGFQTPSPLSRPSKRSARIGNSKWMVFAVRGFAWSWPAAGSASAGPASGPVKIIQHELFQWKSLRQPRTIYNQFTKILFYKLKINL